eukprot:TRINITY_DN4621_c0_g1_i1.p1 TRINITY_DN4621_c0_g1~~TRINITY_DN4621_c0_g1_i1.p1  ORF type:complete len:351 (-),score=37.54 TRINITY_DN4621_c0_g1_i1:267-1319(-)
MKRSVTSSPSLSDFADLNDFKIKDAEIVYRQKSPKTVRQYLLGDVLGKGSYGKVREALDTNSLQITAIKIINKTQLRKLPGGAEASLLQEIALARQLKHQNVVGFVESFQIDEKDKLYIALEYVDGGTLRDLLNKTPKGKLPFPQARSFLRDLMHGLNYIHAQGIVHRDIKPENLMLTSNGQLKISDFGVAELLSSFEDSSFVSKTQGTPAYQPPEIASGSERSSGSQGDLWAAGVTLYNITTGQYPFEGNTIFTLLENIAAAKYTIPNSIPKDLSIILRGLLEPDKNKRFTADDALKSDWMEDESKGHDDWADVGKMPTLFTKDFLNEIAKIKENGKRDRKRSCICVLF